MFSDADISALVGAARAARGAAYAAQGMVLSVAMTPMKPQPSGGAGARPSTLVAHVSAPRPVPYLVKVTFAEIPGGLKPIYGECSCRDGQNCKHVAAALLAYLDKTTHSHNSKPATTADTLSTAHHGTPFEPPKEAETTLLTLESELGLQINLDQTGSSTANIYLPRNRAGTSNPDTPIRFGLRPIIRSATGRWLRNGLDWNGLTDSTRYSHDPGAGVLRAMYRLAGPRNRYHAAEWIWSTDATCAALWSLLDEAHRSGVELVLAEPRFPAVSVVPGRAQSRIFVDAGQDDSVVLHSTLFWQDSEDTLDLDGQLIPIGNPTIGFIARSDDAGRDMPHRLVFLKRPQSAPVTALLRAVKRVIPAEQRTDFLTRQLPQLMRDADLVTFGEGMDLGLTPRMQVRVQVTFDDDHKTVITITMRHHLGRSHHDDPVTSAMLQAGTHEPSMRVFFQLAEANDAFAWVWQQMVQSQHSIIELTGLDTADFAMTMLPQLKDLAQDSADFQLEIVGEPARYDILSAEKFSVATQEDSRDRDWFDLNVTVDVAGKNIPLPDIFKALARGDEYLLLPGGGMIPLHDPRLERLRDLIEQAQELRETSSDSVQVSRYHAAFFDELAEAGYLGNDAETWLAGIAKLAADTEPADLPVPHGLVADLRHYQYFGFQWLAYRASHGLGAVLADDMGLGKTLQTIALFLHLKQSAAAVDPFLVVAPTSVVDNWVAECRRFAPSLRVVAIHGTAARQGKHVGDLIGDADVVVTSYALLRLEADGYRSLDWSGAVFDEAQFVKNHRSQGFKAATRLVAPFKIALTGTPLENNVMELWSLFALTCPGLLPGVKQFTQEFARPIARGQAFEVLARLRRAVGPFLLRRTKNLVASDLPEKFEHVTEVSLQPKHRTIYDRYLQRERAKVLGVLDDLDGHRVEVLRSLTLLRQASLDVSLVDAEHAQAPSSKLDVLLEMLDEIIAEGHNVLIFSQFTRYLAKVRDAISARGVDVAYLDGKTRDRAHQIERFTSGKVQVFLISLKAGGFGLNLTNADYCFLLDPWWNPATESQAVDRAHRIGQTRNVMVYRFVARDTIESKVMALKAEKAQLFAAVVDGAGVADGQTAETQENSSSGMVSLSANDIRALLDA